MKKLASVLLIAGLFVAVTYGYPGKLDDSKENSEESRSNENGKRVVLVLPKTDVFSDMDDLDVSQQPILPTFWHPFRTESFGNMFSKLQELMNAMQSQFESAVKTPMTQINPWGKLPEGANTTSTKKVVGNHTVTINETTYHGGNDNMKSIFHIRVVDVKPNFNLTDTINNSSEEEMAPKQPESDESKSSKESEEIAETTASIKAQENTEELNNEIPKVV